MFLVWIDFELGLGWVFRWVWVDFKLGSGWVFRRVWIDFELSLRLIFDGWVDFGSILCLDFQPLKWVVVMEVGSAGLRWCWWWLGGCW